MAWPSTPRARTTNKAAPAGPPVVFLSYSHAESEIAHAFREHLSQSGLDVRVDSRDLKVAQNIEEFARSAIHSVDATVCLVSRRSLQSAWVMFEALTALRSELPSDDARLIACATDATPLDSTFGLEIAEAARDKVRALDSQIGEYLSRQLDITGLSKERQRWLDMSNGFGRVLERIQHCLTPILTATNLQESAQQVADHIRDRRGQAPARNDPRDIRARAEELLRHLDAGRTNDALDRLHDYVRDFSNLPEHVRRATFIANTLRRLDRGVDDRQLTFTAAEKLRQPQIEALIILIGEIEIQPHLPLAS